MNTNKVNINVSVWWCIKQYLSKIWSSIHEKVKQHWVWVEKCIAYKKKHSSKNILKSIHLTGRVVSVLLCSLNIIHNSLPGPNAFSKYDRIPPCNPFIQSSNIQKEGFLKLTIKTDAFVITFHRTGRSFDRTFFFVEIILRAWRRMY